MRIDSRTARTLGTLAAALVLALAWWALPHLRGDDPGQSSPSGGVTREQTRATVDPQDVLPVVSEDSLPQPAQQTLALIDAGGPFPYPDHDGGVFGNYEGLLPAESGGYYHEYTVEDPAEDDRGPWRIITGAGGELYWTADHYAHFERIERSP